MTFKRKDHFYSGFGETLGNYVRLKEKNGLGAYPQFSCFLGGKTIISEVFRTCPFMSVLNFNFEDIFRTTLSYYSLLLPVKTRDKTSVENKSIFYYFINYVILCRCRVKFCALLYSLDSRTR